MEYKARIADDLLAEKLESFGATLVIGPKGCGKTTTAKQKAKSFKMKIKEPGVIRALDFFKDLPESNDIYLLKC